MKTKSAKIRLLSALLTLCVVLAAGSAVALAAEINYIDKIHVAYTYIEYQAGDAPRATASVTEGNCTVAYEYWCELEQKAEGGVWTSTGRYWYSDPNKMASLSEDKRITTFEAGHHYSYNIVLVADRGYFISGDETVVSVGEYEWGTPGSSTNLEVKEMSTKLHIYSPYSIGIPDESPDQVITGVSIIGVNQDLDASKPITFTAKSADWCAGQYDIVEEAWEAGGEGGSDVIKSTDAAPRAPRAGGAYWYSIVLRAKDGYVFSKDFSDENCHIKEGSEVTFALGGVLYESSIHVSEDGKTLTAWEFMDPVTVKGGDGADESVIEKIEIVNAALSYAAGDAPKATAGRGGESAPDYEIEYEYWEQMETDGTGESVPVAYWYSDDARSQALAEEKRIASFEEGKTYMYSILLRASEGHTFSQNGAGLTMTLNGAAVSAQNITVGQDGKTLFAFALKTLKPAKAPEAHEHTYAAAWSYDESNHWHECVCGAQTDQAAHTFQWVVTKEASATEKGSRYEQCSVCGYKKAAEEIPATGAVVKPADQPAKAGEKTSPKTGDAGKLAVWAALLLLGGGGAACAAAGRRKKPDRR